MFVLGAVAPAYGRATIDPAIARLLPATPDTIKAQGRPLQLRFGPGDMVTVQSFSFEPRPGIAQGGRGNWCGVTVRAAGKPVQAVVTVGTGATWYADCGQLRAIGTLPAPAGQAWFAVINDVGSPNVTEPGAAILTRNGGSWKLDEKLSADPRLENVPVTIPALRRALMARR